MKKISILFLLSIVMLSYAKAQRSGACVAFYNLENIFDTIDDPKTNDKDFLPSGSYKWGTMKYNNKLKNMAEVISIIGDSPENNIKWNGPTFLGVCEVENRTVLEDLVNTPKLKPMNYGIVHFDSPDERGVDVGFLYKKDFFRVLSAKAHPYIDSENPSNTTRDQLLVSGIYDEDTLHFIVNHWPSRYAGPEKRVEAAKVCRGIVDSLLNVNKDAKVFVMGDFNDTPVDPSLNWLTHKSEKKKNKDKNVVKLHNEFLKTHKQGYGTLAHNDIWQIFDMILVTPAVMNDREGYYFRFADRFDREFLHQKEGRFKGYPLRTHGGGTYLNGYSDHLPVYMYIVKD